MFHRAQLVIDATLVSPLRADGEPHRRCPEEDGAALAFARRRKGRTLPELAGGRGRARRSKPTLATVIRPTLAKPTLANVKVLVVCKDFVFGVNCLGFLKLIVHVFFSLFCCCSNLFQISSRISPRFVMSEFEVVPTSKGGELMLFGGYSSGWCLCMALHMQVVSTLCCNSVDNTNRWCLGVFENNRTHP